MVRCSEETADNFGSQKEPFGTEDADLGLPRQILNPSFQVNSERASAENSKGHPTALPSKQTDPGPHAFHPAPPVDCHKSKTVTRSEHSVHLPGYLKDYVQILVCFLSFRL